MSTRDIREIQASLASELAYSALSLTAEPNLLHAEALKRSKELIEILEVTTTAILLANGVSWEQIARELDGVTRQSFHRRLSRKVSALRNSDPPYVPLFRQETDPESAYRQLVPRFSWVGYLRRLQSDLAEIAGTGNHPAIVKHRRGHAQT